jgi:Pilus formation protein N terminal region
MRRALIAALAIASISPALAADKSGLALSMDEVRTLTFENPITTIYVGNPSIADITMIDARHAFILGKAYGRTNIVALNHDGVQIYNQRVDVAQGGVETLTLNRGAQRVTYNCNSGRCEAQPTPGDGKDVFETMTGQLNTHSDVARKAAGGN